MMWLLRRVVRVIPCEGLEGCWGLMAWQRREATVNACELP